MNDRTFAWRVVACASASLVLVLSGCGTETPKTEASVQRTAETIELSIAGDNSQKLSQQFLDYVQDQGAISKCFLARKVRYSPAPFDSPLLGASVESLGAGALAAVPASTDLAKRDGFGIASYYQRAWKSMRALNTDVPRSEAYLSALSACGSGDATQHVPSDLLDSWRSVQRDTAESSGLEHELARGYPACMAKAGYISASYTDTLQIAGAKFVTFGVPSGPPVGSGGEWSKAVAFEQGAAMADATCRMPIYTAYLKALGAKAQNFADIHAAKLNASRANWKAVTEHATAASNTWYASQPGLARTFNLR